MQFVVIYLYVCNFSGIFQTADYKRKRRILTNGQSYTADLIAMIIYMAAVILSACFSRRGRTRALKTISSEEDPWDRG